MSIRQVTLKMNIPVEITYLEGMLEKETEFLVIFSLCDRSLRLKMILE